MPPQQTPKQGKKRTRSGREKTPTPTPPNETPTCAQPPRPSTSTLASSNQSAQNPDPTLPAKPNPAPKNNKKNPKAPKVSKPLEKKEKLPRLPSNASIQKRPLHHPAPPLPYTSSHSPKTLYLTTTSPYIPTLKRIRTLLTSISDRAAQSEKATLGNLRSNGRLSHKEVERAIADGHTESGRKKGKETECVYVKATGRAIPRALEIGVHFQGEKDCKVRVELGSVKAVDDIDVDDENVPGVEGEGEEKGDVVMRDVGNDEGAENQEDGKNRKKKKQKKKVMAQDDIPETRVRSLSSVTVSICLV